MVFGRGGYGVRTVRPESQAIGTLTARTTWTWNRSARCATGLAKPDFIAASVRLAPAAMAVPACTTRSRIPVAPQTRSQLVAEQEPGLDRPASVANSAWGTVVAGVVANPSRRGRDAGIDATMRVAAARSSQSQALSWSSGRGGLQP